MDPSGKGQLYGAWPSEWGGLYIRGASGLRTLGCAQEEESRSHGRGKGCCSGAWTWPWKRPGLTVIKTRTAR